MTGFILCRFKMSLSLLFLLLAAATAFTDDHQTNAGAYPDGVDPNIPYLIIHSLRFKKHHQTLIEARKTTNLRQKRTVSVFFRAWKRLLKTTIGFQKLYNNIGGVFVQGRTYLKVGSLDNARRDFHSLGPTNIEQRPYGLSGEVGNKLVLLRSNPTQIVVLDIDSPKLFPRAIEYRETFAEANNVGKFEGRFPLH